MNNLAPDLFQTNKFSNCYAFLIERAQEQNRKRLTRSNPNYAYYENHHIIPKSMNGSDKTENLVLLTAREHFICHWLLTQMCLLQEDRYKMLCALGRMIGSNNYQSISNQSRVFELAREERSKELSKRMSGSSNPMFGTTWDQDRRDLYEAYTNRGIKFSDEDRADLYAGRIGATRSKETKDKISKSLTGKTKTADHIAKVQVSRAGFKHSEETRQRISKTNMGRTKSEDTKAKYHATIAEQRENRRYRFEDSNGNVLVMNVREASEIGLKADGIKSSIRLNRPYKGYTITKVQPT